MFQHLTAFDLPRIAGNIFIGFGALIAGIGILVVFDDPGGFFAILFGLAFVGVGFLARRFAVPKGMQEVMVSGHAADVSTWDGRHGTRKESTVIRVDKNASAAEIAAARNAWFREQWLNRSDWAKGLIRSDDAKYGTLAYWAAGVWSFFVLGALGAALLWGDIAWLVLAGSLPVALAFVISAIRLALRRRKFSESWLTLARTPAALGGKLEGSLCTGVLKSVQLRDGFSITLRCVHRWEEHSGSGSNRHTTVRRDTLWETQATRSGRVTFESPTLVVAVNIDLPTD